MMQKKENRCVSRTQEEEKIEITEISSEGYFKEFLESGLRNAPVSNTRKTIILKKALINEIEQMKQSSNRTIIFKNFFEKCVFSYGENIKHTQMKRDKDIVYRMLEHLRRMGRIADYKAIPDVCGIINIEVKLLDEGNGMNEINSEETAELLINPQGFRFDVLTQRKKGRLISYIIQFEDGYQVTRNAGSISELRRKVFHPLSRYRYTIKNNNINANFGIDLNKEPTLISIGSIEIKYLAYYHNGTYNYFSTCKKCGKADIWTMEEVRNHKCDC